MQNSPNQVLTHAARAKGSGLLNKYICARARLKIRTVASRVESRQGARSASHRVMQA